MAHDHPDAPKQYGIRISDEVMELVSAIQEHRKRTNQPITLAAIVEDAIECYLRPIGEVRGQSPMTDDPTD
jgi:predicted DNA-binding protein